MGIKRYKNAIREARANGSYLRFLRQPVSSGLVLIDSDQGKDAGERLFALFTCMEKVHSAEKRYSGKLKSGEYRQLLATAEYIIADRTLPEFFIKREGQKILLLCDSMLDGSMSGTYPGLVQKTVLAADELAFSDEGRREEFLERFMLKGLMTEGRTLQKGADVYYCGDLSRPEDRWLARQMIDEQERGGEAEGNCVIAFESEMKPEVESFIEGERHRAGFVQIMQGGPVTFGDYVFQYLYKNYGLFRGKAEAYYERESRRIFCGMNIDKLHFVTTDIYERIEVILKSGFRTVTHRIPMNFYKKLVDVFCRHPKRIDKVFSRFSETVEYSGDFGGEVWDENICNGISAGFRNLKLRVNGGIITLSGNLEVIAEDRDAVIDECFVIGSTIHERTFTYKAETGSERRADDHGMTIIKCGVRVQFPAEDISEWYNINLPLIRIRSCGHDMRVPVLASGSRGKVYEIGNTGYAFEIRADYRHLRFVIRQANVTDRTVEKIKLAAAFACHLVTPWHRPVLLCEKYCRNYEESASVLFERLVDEGYAKARFVLNKDSAGRNGIDGRYEKYIVDQFSFRHYYSMFAARSIISSEAIGHCLEKGTASSLFKTFVADGSKNYVFLQHGVMYMVSLSAEQRNFFRKGKGKGKQRVVVSSRLEAEHFLENTNYKENDIYNCGLVKFDRSVLDEDADRIMVMLTWRPWEFITGLSCMKETGYYRMLQRIVSAVPENFRDRLIVMPHPLIAGMADFDRTDEVWKYSVSGVKYDDILKKTALLITDYSSISYDAFYRGSSVIFDWEEKDRCIAEYGRNSRLMLTDDLAFGKVCRNDRELSEAIAGTYGVERDRRYEENFRKIVEHHDGKNGVRFMEMAKKDGII